MDHKAAKYRRASRIASIGQGIGCIVQAIVCAGFLGSHYLTKKSYEEIIKLKDEIIDAQEGTIQAKEGTIQAKESRLEIQQTGLKAGYPEIVAPPEAALKEEERRDIEALLTAELPLEESKKRVRENICRIETSFINIRSEPSVVGNEVRGTCLFLTPTIVLTAYHVPDAHELSFFYESLSYTLSHNGHYISAHQPIAISPRYDLALLRLDEAMPSVKPVPVGIATEDTLGDAFFLYSLQYAKDGHPEYGLSVEEHMLTAQEREQPSYIMTTEGRLDFPSLITKPFFPNGYSGSPVLRSDGKIVGVLSKGNEKKDTASISDYVSSFLKCLLDQPQCSGWEK